MSKAGFLIGLALSAGMGVVALRRAMQPPPPPAPRTFVATSALASGPDGRPWSGDMTGRIGPHGGPYRFAHEGPVRSLTVEPDGGTFSVGADSVARFAADGRPVQRWRLPDRHLNAALALGEDVLVGAERGDVARLTPDGPPRWRVRAVHGRAVFGLALAPDGERAASVGADGRIIIWRVSDGVQVAAWAAHAGLALAVAWPAEGPISVGSDGELVWWTPEGQAVRRITTGHAGVARGLIVGPERVITLGGDDTIRVFGRLDGRPGPVLHADAAPLAALLRGPRLITSHADGGVRRWDVVTGVPAQ